ncbi:hypothetical protein A3F07_03280 [candidate division WWE3 bacterium RIFCSPHIGHO2_12_FULL_38_15]|uniref:Type II secretion system protein GspH n=1 Tax=candidate division WWE3 bacterium RIFCSPHIGHO2_02_FULL_38_14 TaxID=1802620 RepID=A0A1F4V702_UNCKA|nr:MAG: hypothetical protein A2793_03105 [candidate division WWE3 bacterium RIFCSPHIGHO2_01_FULL_38_45]OGC48824.1 MAG: hypothetical protein A3F07_03280 [candidate division WWE3 bacterium RIFCSPHIGHO2_12_FULL_38_15]OGC52780.1 MAG: hypothetical protein A3D91_01970 [candidate division WWE3 bacterium RIFCSPHIGHO2_02_FULL_38_14]OGC53127.1 MAG: hypothetical protein A3B64_01620 [candidate division WWE3 bacterium RIFCSPLOWO2_01_FULL_37_24]HLB51966.1 type II secretion system protein [Patescibacteria gro
MSISAPIAANNRNIVNGFTLIELLIVVVIVSILTGALIPSFSGFIKNQNLRQAQEILLSDLRGVQNKAITGTASSTGANYWGINITSNPASSYTYFSSELNTSCTPGGVYTNQGSSQPFTSPITINSSQGCLFFSMENGDANFIGLPACPAGQLTGMTCINICDSATSCRYVGMNANGLIVAGN